VYSKACANAHGPGGKLAFVDVDIQGHRPAVGHVALKAIRESFRHRSSNNGSVGQVGFALPRSAAGGRAPNRRRCCCGRGPAFCPEGALANLDPPSRCGGLDPYSVWEASGSVLA